ncbi:MAG: M42 family peptidase [Anaerolineales bacterium]
MPELLPFLKDLLSAPGLSIHEGPVAEMIRARWAPLVDEISLSRVGSLHALRKGTAAEPRPSVLIATHMDAIGLMVTRIEAGFLHITQVGGVDARVLPGQRVTVHGRQDLPGVVVQPSPRLLPPGFEESPVPLEYLLVDTGLPPRRVDDLVRVGDLVSFAQPPLELAGETIAGHTLDNRASVAALTVCLEGLQHCPHAWDVWAVATAAEEVGLIGASTSAFQLRPTLAIVLDVTFAKGPGASDWNTFPLGKGPTLVMGANMHPALHKALKDLADKLEIPYALEYAPTRSGTDASATQVTAEGIPSAVIGIPLRYMHTPVEVVAIKDIQRAGRLLAEFIAGLTPDFVEKITWDD